MNAKKKIAECASCINHVYYIKSRCHVCLRVCVPLQHLQELSGAGQAMSSSGSGTPGPPPYEVIAQSQGPSELPPPTYAEAVALLQQAGIQGTCSSYTTRTLITYIHTRGSISSRPPAQLYYKPPAPPCAREHAFNR